MSRTLWLALSIPMLHTACSERPAPQGAEAPALARYQGAEATAILSPSAHRADWFASSLDLHGEALCIGAIGHDLGGHSSGAAFVAQRTAGQWSGEAMLLASDPHPWDWFGRAVGLQAGRAAIGAPGADTTSTSTGAVYLFEDDGLSWVETAKLTASDATAYDSFGATLALTGDRLLIGAPDQASDAGSVYVFEATQGVWAEVTKLVPSDPLAHQGFGLALATEGDLALIGSRDGSAYLFQFDGTSWSQHSKLVEATTAPNHVAVALHGDHAAVTGPQDEVILFERTEGVWAESARLPAPAQALGHGASLSFGDDLLAVGAPKAALDGYQSGAVFMYRHLAQGWGAPEVITNEEPWVSQAFGATLALQGPDLLVGAPRAPLLHENAGAVHPFTLTDVNTPPTLTVSPGILAEGASLRVTSAQLMALDEEQTASSLVYELTLLPTVGTLSAGGEPLLLGDTFTHGEVISGAISYLHDGSESLTDALELTLTDQDLLSATGRLELEILPVNDPPAAQDDSAEVLEGGTALIDILLTDTDPEGQLDPTSVQLLSPPAHGAVVVHAATGALTYSHDSGESTTDQLSYTVCDVQRLCASATVTLQITPVNDPPVATPDSFGVEEGRGIQASLIANDTDPEGLLDLTSLKILAPPAHGTASITPTGELSYHHNGTETPTDALTYGLCDTEGLCDTGLVSLSITLTNDAPTLAADRLTVEEAGTASLDVLLNDTDPEGLDPQSATLLGQPAHGVATHLGAGLMRYVHDGSETTTDRVDYQVCDLQGLCERSWLELVITPVNDPPVASPDAYELLSGEEVPPEDGLLLNDVDAEQDPLTAQLHAEPEHGQLTLRPHGGFTYTADPGFVGEDSFYYSAHDGQKSSEPAEVLLTVEASGSQPTGATGDTATTAPDTGGGPKGGGCGCHSGGPGGWWLGLGLPWLLRRRRTPHGGSGGAGRPAQGHGARGAHPPVHLVHDVAHRQLSFRVDPPH